MPPDPTTMRCSSRRLSQISGIPLPTLYQASAVGWFPPSEHRGKGSERPFADVAQAVFMGALALADIDFGTSSAVWDLFGKQMLDAWLKYGRSFRIELAMWREGKARDWRGVVIVDGQPVRADVGADMLAAEKRALPIIRLDMSAMFDRIVRELDVQPEIETVQ